MSSLTMAINLPTITTTNTKTKTISGLKLAVATLALAAAVSLAMAAVPSRRSLQRLDGSTRVQPARSLATTQLTPSTGGTLNGGLIENPNPNQPPNNTFVPPILSAITTGDFHACVLDPADVIWCWGGTKTIYVEQEVEKNIGTSSSPQIIKVKIQVPQNIVFSTPLPVLSTNGQPLQGAVAISAGSNHTCALKKDGTVWCWGAQPSELSNQSGELGNGTTIGSEFAVQVLTNNNGMIIVPLSGVTAIAAGGSHTCALKNDASLWCWGGNDLGALGNNSRDDSSLAVPVAGNHLFTAVNADTGSTCAVDQATALWCWGEHIVWGGFGPGFSLVPSPLLDNQKKQIIQVRSLAHEQTADRFLAFQKNNDSSLWGLGTIPPGRDVGGPNTINVFEQLGQFVDSNNQPLKVWRASTAGGVGGHACVINTSDTSAACWGVNFNGDLGDGTQADRQFPTQVVDSKGAVFTHWYQIETGAGNFTCGLRFNSAALNIHDAIEVWCWGWNNYGQLGNGTTNDSAVPVQVKMP